MGVLLPEAAVRVLVCVCVAVASCDSGIWFKWERLLFNDEVGSLTDWSNTFVLCCAVCCSVLPCVAVCCSV